MNICNFDDSKLTLNSLSAAYYPQKHSILPIRLVLKKVVLNYYILNFVNKIYGTFSCKYRPT